MAGQATWRHSPRRPRKGLLGFEWGRRCSFGLLSLRCRAGLPLFLGPWRPLLPDLSERDDREELEEPEA